MIGQRLADRYEVLEEGPRALGGRLFRARDAAFEQIVAVKQIAAGTGAGAGLRELEAEVRKAQRFSHPTLVRHDTLHVAEGLLVREWVHGFSLLELLKRRHRLSADETLRLLPALGTALDFVARHGLPLPRQLLGKLLMQFDPSVALQDIVTLGLGEWPPFALRLNPLSVRASLLESDGQTTLTSVSDLHTLLPELRVNAPVRLAELLYEVLGGHVRSDRDRRYTPLHALHEEGNGVLRRALNEGAYTNCQALWADLERVEPSELRPVAPLAAPSSIPARSARIPEPLLARLEPAARLKLTPAERSTPALHLITGPSFKIGRSLVHADFATRFLPESAANDDLTNQLSRIHVLAEARGQRLTLRDGNGEAPSVNGTTLDEEPLSDERPALLTHRVLLSLGGVYSLEVVPLVSETSDRLKIANLAGAPVAEPPGQLAGAVLFLPVRGLRPVRQAAWLFSEAGFGLDFQQHIVWDTRGTGESPASFHHHRGCFWLRNRLLPAGLLEVAGSPLAPDDIAPLNAGQALRIGALRFKIELA